MDLGVYCDCARSDGFVDGRWGFQRNSFFFSFLTARPMFPTVKVPLAVRELSRELVPMSPKCTTHFIDSHIFARCDPICIFLSFTQNVTL